MSWRRPGSTVCGLHVPAPSPVRLPGARLVAGAFALVALVALVGCSEATEPDHDVILRGGTVYDGTGAPGVVADVALDGGFVSAVGDLGEATGEDEIDVTGLRVMPGIVNLHSHDRLDAIGVAENLLLQGVTTIILNADGGGPLDIGAQLEEAERGGLAVNIGANIGFNTAWSEINGPDDRRPTEEELAAMSAVIEDGLEAGAWGVSGGLDYKPAYYATTDEVIDVLEGAGPWRTLFTNHDRLIPETGFSSIVGMRETIEIGEATGLMPVITHMKIQGREQGTSDEVLQMMRDAGDRGVHTAADAYPYLAGQTSLAALIIPGWAQAGGRDAFLSRLADPEISARIVAEADEAMAARFGGPSGVYLPESRLELTDVMEEMGVTSGGEAVVRLLREESPGAILRFGSEDDLVAILSHPTTSIACDCDAVSGVSGHPRAWGTFPRVFGRYVREQGVLTWESAVHKMTGLPATTIGMVDRGFLAPGMAADVVVVDPESVLDHATFAAPTTPSEGVVHVWVNGRNAVRDGAVNPVGGGRALRRLPGMPARAPELMFTRALSTRGTVGADQAAVRVALDVQQGIDGRPATGSVEVEAADGAWRLDVERLGLLQVGPEWGAVSGWGRLDGAAHAFVVIVDRGDPRVGVPTVTVLVDGDRVVFGRLVDDP